MRLDDGAGSVGRAGHRDWPSGLHRIGSCRSSSDSLQLRRARTGRLLLAARSADRRSRRRHPERLVEAIVQFKATVSPERARWDVSRASQRARLRRASHHQRTGRQADCRARPLARRQPGRPRGLPERRGQVRGPERRRHVSPGGPIGRAALAARPSAEPASPEHLRPDARDVTSGLWRGAPRAGVGVAVIDTGIDGDLPDFQGATGSRVIATAVTNPNATTATDSYGHGTDVAGIIAGNGNNLAAASNPLKGDYVGVAPEANLVSIKASDETRQRHGPRRDLRPAVRHRSPVALQHPRPQHVAGLADAAVLHDRSARCGGRGGLDARDRGGRGGGQPGDDPGAVQYAPANDPVRDHRRGRRRERHGRPRATTRSSSWSSHGTTQDGFQKPDVYAPGAHIVSVLAPHSVFATHVPALP